MLLSFLKQRAQTQMLLKNKFPHESNPIIVSLYHQRFKFLGMHRILQMVQIWGEQNVHIGLTIKPHDALKHNFTSLKTDLIFLQPRGLERKFP